MVRPESHPFDLLEVSVAIATMESWSRLVPAHGVLTRKRDVA
jgi:hypothetical protein